MTPRINELIEELKQQLCDLSKVSTAELVAELASRFVIKPTPDLEQIDDIEMPHYCGSEISENSDIITL